MHGSQCPALVRRSALEREPYFVRDDLDFVLDRDLIIRLSRRSRFVRARGVTAIDRHQRDRKVLRSDFAVEAAAHDRELGVSTGVVAIMIRRVVLVLARLVGAAVMLRLPATIDSAVELRIPPLAERLRLQLLTSRRKMRF